MAETGYNWTALAHLTHSAGTDIDDIAVADDGTLTSDVVSNDIKAATEIAVKTIEDNTGATDGNVDIYLFRSDLDPDTEVWQTVANDNPVVSSIDQSQNATHIINFVVPGGSVSRFKVYVVNSSGQEIALTINYRQATIPVAS